MIKPVRHIKLLIGACGTGKTTYIQKNHNEFRDYTIISLDSIIAKLAKIKGMPTKNVEDMIYNNHKEEVERIYYATIKEAVKKGDNIIIDRNNSTNYIRKHTLDLVKKSKDFSYISTAIFLHPPKEMEYIKRLFKRAISDGRFGTLTTSNLQKIEPIRKGMFNNVIEIGKPQVVKPSSQHKEKEISWQKLIKDAKSFTANR